jgi:ABC-type dipeptide/oligopeptide/nickel transport system permease component
VRASLLEVAGGDYGRGSEGLTRRRVLGRHVLRNALLRRSPCRPRVRRAAAAASSSSSSFGFPGIGVPFIVSASDYNAIMGATLLVAVTYVLTNPRSTSPACASTTDWYA